MPTESLRAVLRETLTDLLGKPEPGSMAYIRCLPADVALALAADPAFAPGDWQLAVVTDQADPARRRITAAQAVEWREDKGDALLLLIDPRRAGAGLDGIYSAAREITEADLFTAAIERARGQLPHGFKGFALKALKKAGWQRRRGPLAPWAALEYLGRGLDEPAAVGSALPLIGLWPVAFVVTGKPDDADLERAALLVQRLLPKRGARMVPEQRVAALLLPPEEQENAAQLTGLLRETDGLPVTEALRRAQQTESVWLHRLHPGLFDQVRVQGVELMPWRKKDGKPYSWSGLIDGGADALELCIPLDDAAQARLEVRWTARPHGLAAGTVTWQVQVVAGNSVLAGRTLPHRTTQQQKVVFGRDDFDELDEHARYQAQVRVAPLGESDCPAADSETFVLCFGDAPVGPAKESAGRKADTLALAAIQIVPDWDAFKKLAGQPASYEADKQGYIVCKWQGQAAKVFRPPLFKTLSDDWIERGGALGRWRLRVREDGTEIGAPEFIPMDGGDGHAALAAASAALAAWLKPTQGPLGVLYLVDEFPAINKYVAAAETCWRTADPTLTLIQTLEIQSLAGECLGLIVLPTHPLRVAWQQGFDLMVAYHCYRASNAQKLTPKQITEILKPVTGAHYPAFLPGLAPGQTFVFGDTLGFHGVAMVRADDPEPRATLALLSRLLGGDAATAPSVGQGAALALAGELTRYLQLHPLYRRVRVHALRAGDAMPVARALGRAMKDANSLDDGDDGDGDDGHRAHCFELELYPGTGQSTAQTGRFLAATVERRRSGAGAVPEEDRWLLQSVSRPGGVSLPRLRWARRDQPDPTTPAHVAIAFDVFRSSVKCCLLAELPKDGALEAHGLMLVPSREFMGLGTPCWRSFVPPEPKGEPHPFTKKLTRRQLALHAAVLRATARHLGGDEQCWPVLVTEVGSEQAAQLAGLHDLCDWVMTADRNGGIEYFDSPRELPEVYEAYIIDCVPERDDLGFMQLITSTSSLEEVIGLFDAALGEMGLSASPRHCRWLLDALKAVSGRLALRLAGAGTSTRQMVALALVQRQMERAAAGDEIWPALTGGFLIPVDDVPELFRRPASVRQTGVPGDDRADLLYVRLGDDGGLAFDFIEVKFRRYLKTARAADLAEMMDRQLGASCQRWQELFGPRISTLEQTVNRAWLARILRFYARKGRRHGLAEDVYGRLMRQIDRMVQSRDTTLPEAADLRRIGFVFCPEYGGVSPVRIDQIGHADLWLFGPTGLVRDRVVGAGDAVGLDQPAETVRLGAEQAEDCADERPAAAVASAAPTASTNASVGEPPATIPAGDIAAGLRAAEQATAPVVEPVAMSAPMAPVAQVLLGRREAGEEPLYWRPVIGANPHLMILGQPGMGKTTSLINICLQLHRQGITPIVFSYHEDIDEQLTLALPTPPSVVRYAGLGFNPLEVVGAGPVAYLDNAGMLRDIFAAIFPDLGDVQLGRLRDALKQSYLDQGWGGRGRSRAGTSLPRLLRPAEGRAQTRQGADDPARGTCRLRPVQRLPGRAGRRCGGGHCVVARSHRAGADRGAWHAERVSATGLCDPRVASPVSGHVPPRRAAAHHPCGDLRRGPSRSAAQAHCDHGQGVPQVRAGTGGGLARGQGFRSLPVHRYFELLGTAAQRDRRQVHRPLLCRHRPGCAVYRAHQADAQVSRDVLWRGAARAHAAAAACRRALTACQASDARPRSRPRRGAHG